MLGLNDKSVHLGIILYQLLSLCLPPLNRAKLQVFLKFVSHLSSTYTKVLLILSDIIFENYFSCYTK